MGGGKKLRSSGGFTLAELLVAVIILGLLTLAVTTGISAGFQVYRQSVDLSHSQVLTSTLAQAIAEELRYARDIVLKDDELTSYTSTSYGLGAKLLVEDGRVAVQAAGKAPEPLIGSGTYVGYRVGLKLEFDEDCFQVEVTVFQSDGVTALRIQPFTVRPLNDPPEDD